MLHLLRKKKKSVNKHDHVIDRLAEANAIFSGIALFPQLVSVWRTHDVQMLSATTFIIMFVANVIWTLYGLHRKDSAVVVSSGLVLVSSGGLAILSLLWKT
jgi:uncharacterized protein with PQ loop repeat